LRSRALLQALIVAGATVAVSAALVRIAGASPQEAWRTLLQGSLGSRAAVGETLMRSTGMLLCALAAVVAFRGGVFNIGAEGQFLAGACAAAALGPLLPAHGWLAQPLLALVAMAAGALVTLPALWLAERRGVPAVLSTILLNMMMAAMLTWLVRGPLRDPAGDFPQSRPLHEELRLDPLVSGARATAAVPVAFALAAALAWALYRTPAGLKLRAAGEAPLAVRAAGLNDVLIRTCAFAASGALAGLGGGLEITAITGRLYDPFTSGVGYTGIAAALLGGTHPLGAAAASLLFAALGAGSSAMQRDAGVPASLSMIAPALAMLALLAARGRGDPPR